MRKYIKKNLISTERRLHYSRLLTNYQTLRMWKIEQVDNLINIFKQIAELLLSIYTFAFLAASDFVKVIY